MLKKIVKILYYIPFLPIVFLIRLISKFFLIRIGELPSDRIGHFMGIVEIYLCKKEHKKDLPTKKYLDLFFMGKEICNSQLAKFWKRKLLILPRIFLAPIKNLNDTIPGGEKNDFYYNEDVFEKRMNFEHRDLNNLIDVSKIHYLFLKNEINTSEDEIRNLGIDLQKKIVVINLRDNAYFKIFHKDYSLDTYSQKNCDIDDYRIAIEYLLNNNYQVIRTGQFSEKKLNLKNKNYFDLTNYRNDRVELYLLSKCSFFIGCNSGATCVPLFLFRKYTYFSNFLPIGIFNSSSKKAFYNFKVIKYKINGKKLTFTDMLDENLFYSERTSDYIDKNIIIESLSPDQILEDIKEIILLTEQKLILEKEDILLKKKFINAFEKNLITSNKKQYYRNKITCHISKSYLRKNEEIFV